MPVTYTCQACGKQFQGAPSQKRKYCSPACAYSKIKGSERAPRVTLRCLHCGKEIRKRQEQVDKGLGHFCSRSCRSKYYPRRHPLGTELAEHFVVHCPGCGKELRRTAADIAAGRRRYCSRACVNAGREHPERRKDKVTKHCLVCGKEFQTFPSTAERHQYCSRQCLGYATQTSQPRTLTTIELALQQELADRGVVCEAQYHLPPWIIDIALPANRIAIEADGEYWHSLPQSQKRDARKDADLSAKGWTVLRFWEHEIRESPARCVDRVLACLAECAKSA